MIKLEKLGVPTVSWTCSTFMRDAAVSARALGLNGLPLAEIAIPGTPVSDGEIREAVSASFPQIVEGLTRQVNTVSANEVAPSEVLTFEGDDLLESFEKMNQHFLEKSWSDGFPLIPPTPEAVARMIGGTRLNPESIVAVLEPGFGVATVEKIAINAVMAGCRPEHLPVIIAAVQCLSDPRMILRNHLISTAAQTPLILVNGPIAKRINMNSKSCALGPASVSYVNTVIGRALRLIVMNIGHNYPGISDTSNVGTPLKYSLCAAENEEESPWEPYHVTQGYDRNESTVTVMFVYGIASLQNSRSHGAEDLVKCFSTAMTNGASLGTGLWLVGRRNDPREKADIAEHNFVFLTPEHARLIAGDGWNREKLQQCLYERVRMPFRDLMANKKLDALRQAHPELTWLLDYPDLPLPIVETPDCFDIAVVGHGGACSNFFPGAGGAITKSIEC